MSLSQEPVFSMLQKDFVCGYRDIEHEKWAGISGRHALHGQAVDTTNGAGPHNVQLFVLAPDGTVLTCLPGYWCAQDLADELQLAQRLDGVWQNPALTCAQKCELFQRMQIGHIAEHSAAERGRSIMQPFDIVYESHKHYKSPDLFASSCRGQMTWGGVKTTDVLMHERMARQPFVPYDQFNVRALCDYGQPMYDKHEDSLVAKGHLLPRWRPEGRIGNYHPFADALEHISGI